MTDEEELLDTLSFERELAAELSRQLDDCQGLEDLVDSKFETAAELRPELRGARRE